MSQILSSIIAWILDWLMRLIEAINLREPTSCLVCRTYLCRWDKVHSSWSNVIHMDVFTSLWPPVLRTRCFSPSARCRRCRHPAASGWCSGSWPLRMLSSAPSTESFWKTKLPTVQCHSPLKHFAFHHEVLASFIILLSKGSGHPSQKWSPSVTEDEHKLLFTWEGL